MIGKRAKIRTDGVKKERLFTVNSTYSCKGAALILLLWHHLFMEQGEFGYVVHKIALLSKVCVAIFVILSGYGFSESVKAKNVGLFAFYQRRLVILYSNYWFIAAIFVPLGVLCFDRTLQDVFTSHARMKFMIQMTGLHRFAYSEYGYNDTWWYMSVIIPLIVLFPFIYRLTDKYGLLVPVCFLILILPNRSIFPVVNTWLLPFVLGIYLSQKGHIVRISNRLNVLGNWRFIILVAAIAIVAAFRGRLPLLRDTKIDWLFGGLIILLVFELSVSFAVVETVLSFMGRHLFNIFLFHTFIFSYYWKGFIHAFKSPIPRFVILLTICIGISVLLEQLKELLRFNELVRKISRLPICSGSIFPLWPELNDDTGLRNPD